MGAAGGLRDYLVAHAELHEILGGDLQHFAGFLLLGAVLPQNGRRAAGTYHGIQRVLKHRKLVADRKSERSAGAALAKHHGYHRRPERHELIEISRYRFALTALLSLNAAECAGSVHKADHRAVELLRLLRKTERLAVALRVGHGEIRALVFLEVSALDLRDNSHRSVAEVSDSADYRRIVAEKAVAVELHEPRKHRRNIVVDRGSVLVAYKL